MNVENTLAENIGEQLSILNIDDREYRTINKYCMYLKEIPPQNDCIKEVFISINQESNQPDLFFFTDLFQIRIPSFPKYDPHSPQIPDNNQKSKFEIDLIKKCIVSIDFEIVPKNQNTVRTVNVSYKLKNGKNISLTGKNENSLKLEFLIKNIFMANIAD
jgi:hypothetical protein